MNPRAGRSLSTLALAVAVVLPLAHYFKVAVDRALGPLTVAEARQLAAEGHGKLIEVSLGAARRGRRDPATNKVPLPAAWLDAAGRPPQALVVFLDGQRLPLQLGDAEPGPSSQVFLPGPRTPVVSARCAPAAACRDLVLVHDDPGFRFHAVTARFGRAPLLAAALVVAAALAVAVAWSGLARAASPLTAAGLAAAALLAWAGVAWGAPRALGALVVLEALALGGPVWPSLGAALRAATRAALGDVATARSRAFQVGLLLVAACAFNLPALLAALQWYPHNADDSLHYIFGASRMQASGSFAENLFDPGKWVYSTFPVALGALSAATGVHPMIVYRWLGYLGTALLPLGVAAFAWIATRRFRIALLGLWIASLWGGLGAYLWLASDVIGRLLSGREIGIIETDFFEPRFLGEFAGPYSEVTAYMTSMPLYPRELALLPFWLGLALLYRQMPNPGTRAVGVFAALTVLSASLYPYYGITGLIVLAALPVLRARQRYTGLRSLAPALAVLALTALAVVAVAVVIVPFYRHVSLLDYIRFLWNQPTHKQPRLPALDFDPIRILASHAFGLVAIGAAALRRRRHPEPDGPGWPALPLFGVGLATTLVVGVAGIVSPRAHSLLTIYRWIVPWRALVEPAFVVLTAGAVWRLLQGVRRDQRLVAAALALLPCASPVLWHFNSRYFLDYSEGRTWRGADHELYDVYTVHGQALLGRVQLREPMAVEGGIELLGNYTQAAFGCWDAENLSGKLEYLFLPENEAELLKLMRMERIRDIAALRNGEFARRMLARAGTRAITAFGDYVVLRIDPGPGSEPAR